tara:strand:+ start:1014 stop:1436 length:423 start_codon:yes stop_codon:yes gene_type:complete
MVQNIVEKTMKKAILKYSALEDTNATSIQMMIHTKNEELVPEYFYLVDGIPKRNEKGETKSLTFIEILDKKFDLLNKELIAATWLTSWFKTISDDIECKPSEIYINISAENDKIENIKIKLYKNSTGIREVSLKEIFPED